MELRYRKEAAVGLLIIVGAAVFIFLMMWLRGRSFRQGEVLQATFGDVAGLKIGDPVRTSGVTVGSVKRIELQDGGEVYVWFDVEKGQPPRTDATIAIRSVDFFGARMLAYHPGTSDSALPPGRIMAGTRVEDITEMAAAMGGETKLLLQNANRAASQLELVMSEARGLVRTLNSGAASGTEQLVGSLQNLRMLLHRVDLVVQRNEAATGQALTSVANSAANVDTLTQNLERTTAALDSVLARINSGRGALGQLVNDTALVGELRTTNAAMRDLLVDFRQNPGRYIRLRLF
jgi:phospholipid/cholesterol/gamma-HCH transport system substrate-binding protein